MKKLMLLAILLVGMILIQGCTSTAPFVTDVAFDGNGDLLVMKNTVVYNWFFGTISTGDRAQMATIKLPKK